MRNPLQDQLLKAGLVKKSKVADAVREQSRKRKGKQPDPQADAAKVDAERLLAERAERDRALAAERNAQVRAAEALAQARQIIREQKVEAAGEAGSPYRFTADGAIRSLYVDAAQRAQLARATLVIARDGDGYAMIPRSAAGKVAARDPSLIVLDHAAEAQPATPDSDDDYYSRFPVPDDLVW